MRMLLGLIVSIAGALLATAQAHAAESARDCADCPLMVTVPAGSFKMGSGPNAISHAVIEGAKAENIQDETPQHDVTLKQFAISATEVTHDQ